MWVFPRFSPVLCPQKSFAILPHIKSPQSSHIFAIPPTTPTENTKNEPTEQNKIIYLFAHAEMLSRRNSWRELIKLTTSKAKGFCIFAPTKPGRGRNVYGWHDTGNWKLIENQFHRWNFKCSHKHLEKVNDFWCQSRWKNSTGSMNVAMNFPRRERKKY